MGATLLRTVTVQQWELSSWSSLLSWRLPLRDAELPRGALRSARTCCCEFFGYSSALRRCTHAAMPWSWRSRISGSSVSAQRRIPFFHRGRS